MACAVLALTIGSALASPAAAGRWRGNYRAPAQTNTGRSAAPGPTGTGNGFNSGNSGSGWNRNNSWYNIPQYGNYAPPPYATSKKAFIQVGPLPAFGGVRSLQGWGGAR